MSSPEAADSVRRAPGQGRRRIPRSLRTNRILINSTNCNGIVSEFAKTKTTEIIEKMKTIGVDIHCLQETHRPGNDNLILEGYQIFHHGPDTVIRGDRYGGVAIILSPRAVQGWKRLGQPEPKRHGIIAGTTRIMSVDTEIADPCGEPIKMRVFSCYLPHGMRDDSIQEYEHALKILDRAVKSCPKDTLPIVGGDFNASVGCRRSPEHALNNDIKKTLGPEGNKHLNVLGEILINFAVDNDLAFATTFFKKRIYNTHYNYLLKKSTQIDHFMIPRKQLRRAEDAGVVPTCTTTNHASLQLKLRIAATIPSANDRVKKRSRKKKKDKERRNTSVKEPQKPKKARPNWRAIRNSPEKRKEFNEKLASLLHEFESETDGNKKFEKSMKAVDIAAADTAPLPDKTNRRYWYEQRDPEFTRISKLRDTACTIFVSTGSEYYRKQYWRLQKKTKQMQRKLIEDWKVEKVAEIGELSSSKEAFAALKEFNAGPFGYIKKPVNPKLKKPDGSLTSSPEETASVFAVHFEHQVFSRITTFNSATINSLEQKPTNLRTGAVPSKIEFVLAIKKMKYDKAAGQSNIPADAFKLMVDGNTDFSTK